MKVIYPAHHNLFPDVRSLYRGTPLCRTSLKSNSREIPTPYLTKKMKERKIDDLRLAYKPFNDGG
jgi:hypothetical protein